MGFESDTASARAGPRPGPSAVRRGGHTRKALYILGQLSNGDLEWLIERGKRESLSPGTVIIQQGRPGQNLFLVLAGRLAVIDEEGGGREVAHLGTGEVVGETSFVDASPPPATVKAAEPSEVLSIPREELVSQLERDIGFTARFYRALAILLSERLRETVSRIAHAAEVDGPDDLDEPEDEMDAAFLRSVHQGGVHIDYILKRMTES